MSTFKEYLNESTLNEAGQFEEFLDANKGREGKTLLSPEGKEINKNTFVLSVGISEIVYVGNHGNHVSITTERYHSRDNETVTLTKEEFNRLKRII